MNTRLKTNKVIKINYNLGNILKQIYFENLGEIHNT